MRFDRIAIKALVVLALSHVSVPFRGSSSISSMMVRAEDASADDDGGQTDAPTPPVVPDNAESFVFEAEVSRMLDIVVNSLYQNKDVFLRELISNASDALDKLRYLSLTKPDILNDEEKMQVQIEFDDEQNTLTIRDTGIGMTHDELVSNLGTVARSGTTKFLEALKGDGDGKDSPADISQIGQFGVGFYSAFLVSDRVQVASKHIDSDTQYVWSSANGSSEFNIYEDPRGKTLARGTEITLFLKEDCLDYADENKLSELAKHYSEFVTHPIYLRTKTTMEVEDEDATEDDDGDADDAEAKEDEEKKDEDDLEMKDDDEEKEEKPKKMKEVTTFDWDILNGNPAIWTRPKEDITDEEYQSFYEVLTKGGGKAEIWTHFNAEGNINFKSILFIPKDIPQDYFATGSMEAQNTGLSLYVQKVLISDKFELLPRYLYFMKGVVDSDDLPLNVNRETLQESKIIQVIKKKVVRKALEMIRSFAKESEAEMEKDDEDEDKDDDKDSDDDKEEKDTPKTNKYNDWYKQFNAQLKMGVIDDEPNRNKIMKLLRFKTTTSDGELTSLEKYVENMKDWQKEIYYIAGDSVDAVEKSHFLEQFNNKGVEVFYFVDPVDEYMVSQVRDFDGNRFKNIATDNVKLEDDEEDKDLAKRREKFYKEKFKPLTTWMKKLYGSSIMRVSISQRDFSAPAIVSSAEYGHSANMERIMRAQAYSQGQGGFGMGSMKILEINPVHPMILKLLEGAPPKDAEDDYVVPDDVKNNAMVLLEMALLSGGYPLTSPESHSSRVLKLLQSQLGLESLKLEPHPELPVEEDEPPDADDDIDLDSLNFDMGDMDPNIENNINIEL